MKAKERKSRYIHTSHLEGSRVVAKYRQSTASRFFDNIKMNLLTILVFIISKYIYINAFRTFNVNGMEITYAVKNEIMNIECKANTSIAYCRFTDPSGKRHSLVDLGLRKDPCKLTIQVTKEDEGIWQCHIGSKDSGIENVNNILVKVGDDKVAAIQKNVSAIYGTSVTLECATIIGPKSMKYCRFEAPHNAINAIPYMSFGINSEVKKTNLLMNRFYYPSNKSLDSGDCAVTIHEVSKEDKGLWTCGAGLNDGQEYIDYIKLDVTELYKMTTGSVIAIIFGIIILAGILSLLAWMMLGCPIFNCLQFRMPD